MAHNFLSLNCLIENEHAKRPSIIEVQVPADAKVILLQKNIKKEKAVELREYDSDSLVLWKLKEPFPVGSLDTFVDRITSLGELSKISTQLNEPTQRMSFYFPEHPSQDNLHIIVQRPTVDGMNYDKKCDESTIINPSSGSKRPHKDSNSTINETLHPQPKRARLEKMQGSDTIYKCESNPMTGDVKVLLPKNSNFNYLVDTPNIIMADKTRFIEKLDENPEYQYMFLRPRRWGKSTFLQTLAAYYDKSKKDSFDNTFGQLYIGKNPTPDRSSLLVLLFDFSTVSVLNGHDDMKQSFNSAIRCALRTFLSKNRKFLGNPEVEKLMAGSGRDALDQVLNLVECKGEKLFVGVDEYDAPANSCIMNDKKNETRYKKMAELFKTQFFAIMKQAMGPVVRKYWLTGVLPVFRDGISPLTATDVISMTSTYNDLCGLTEDDVRTIAKAYLGETPQLDARLSEMKRWFNGYRFCHADAEDNLPTLYNPQQVFKHLASAAGTHISIREESNATHSSTILETFHGINLVPDFFMDAHQNKLSSIIHTELGPPEMMNDGILTNDKSARTLLYYFGVLTFHSKEDILYIPNATMRRFFGCRLRRHLDFQSKNPDRPDLTTARKLTSGTTGFVKTLESFLQQWPIRSVSKMNESTFQAIIEAIFIETGPCLPEICLIVNSTRKYGEGRFGFVDLFFPATNEDPHNAAVLELKAVPLEYLWDGMQPTSGLKASCKDLVDFRKKLMAESEEQIMTRKWRYWNKDDERWDTKTLVSLKQEALEQVGRYLEVLSHGSANAHAGVSDFRIRCENGEDVLTSYIVLCIGATRVLAWKADTRKTDTAYVSLL